MEENETDNTNKVIDDEHEAPKEHETQEQSALQKSNAKELQSLVDDIIDNYFYLTKIKLTPDDPTVQLLLVQRLDQKNQVDRLEASLLAIHDTLNSQVTKHQQHLKTIFEDTEEKTLNRFVEVDKRFQIAVKLSDELKTQRQSLLSELSIHHQKHVIQLTKDINEGVQNSKSYSLFALIAGVSSFLMSFALLILILTLVR